MKNWKTYKETYRTESTLFDFARTGDFRGFANFIAQATEFDIDAVNHRGYSALMLAVYNGEEDFCEALLRAGANVNSIDTMGNTVLMGAAFKGNVNLVKLLLHYSADIALENKANMNVRDWAVMFGRKSVLSFLDCNYPLQLSSSRIKNVLRFIKLSVILLKQKINPRAKK